MFTHELALIKDEYVYQFFPDRKVLWMTSKNFAKSPKVESEIRQK